MIELPFGEQALQHFLYLERPEGMERQDAQGFVPTAPPRETLANPETMPRGQEYATIGHLYRGIGDGLQTLVARLGEQAVLSVHRVPRRHPSCSTGRSWSR